MKKYITCGVAALAVLATASCGAPSGWSVSGDISGAPEGSRVALEGFNNGRWYLIDSLDVDSKGRFGYKSGEALHFADIMRVSLPGKGSIYFPADSVDHITIDAAYADFSTDYSISGNPMAADIMAVDSVVRMHTEAASALGARPDATSADLRRDLVEIITRDTTGLVAYYAVGKSVDGRPVFDPADEFGNRVYGAAAQVYATYRPDDPRGAAIRQAYFAGRQFLGKVPKQEQTVIEVPESGVIDIVRYDAKGNEHSLAKLASEGKVVLLSFTGYSLPSSPAYNAVLNDLYELYHSKGLEIYQIAFDDDEVAWKQAAANLPWTAVWNSPADGSALLYTYNVGAVPMTFVINRHGDISERVTDPAMLPKTVAKYF